MHKGIGSLWNSFNYWWGRRSLQSRLVAAYIFIILGPSLLVSIYSFRTINNTYVRDAVDKNNYLLQMEKLHIENQIEVMERAAQIAYSDQAVKSYLSNESALTLDELVDFNISTFKNLNRIQLNNPGLNICGCTLITRVCMRFGRLFCVKSGCIMNPGIRKR